MSPKLTDTATCIAVAVVILLWLCFVYRTGVWFTPDSVDYLSLGLHRPIGYGAFLHGLQALGIRENLRFLPQIQGALLVASLAFFARSVGRALDSLPAALVVLLLPWLFPTFAEAVPSVMTEAPFMAATLAAAALCLAPDPGRRTVLLGIGACLGAATLIRPTGWVLVVAVVLFLFCGTRVFGKGMRWRGLTLLLVPVFGIWLLGTGVQAWLAGRIMLTSFGSVSLIGKGALLADSEAGLPEALHGLPEAAQEARRLIAEAPHYGLRARLRFEAYEDLRWHWIWPRAEAAWPGWNARDRTTWAIQVAPVAAALVRAHPFGYARLVAEDYLALFLWPELMLPGTEAQDRAFLAEQPRRLIAADCNLSALVECWPVLPRVPSVPFWILLLPLSVLSLVASLGVLARAGAATFGLASPPAAVALLAALMLQAQAGATALAEAGLLRYAAPLLPFVVALAVAVCLGAARRLTGRIPIAALDTTAH